MKFEYIVVYENSSDKFDIEHHRIKIKVTVGLQKFSPFTTIQTVRSYNSTLVQPFSSYQGSYNWEGFKIFSIHVTFSGTC